MTHSKDRTNSATKEYAAHSLDTQTSHTDSRLIQLYICVDLTMYSTIQGACIYYTMQTAWLRRPKLGENAVVPF